MFTAVLKKVGCLIFVCLVGCDQYTAYQHLDQALVAQVRGDTEKALEQVQAAVEAQPHDAYVLRRAGWVYAQQKEYESAYVSLQAALQLEPQYLAVFQDLAALAEAQDDADGAIGWLVRAVEAVPDYQPSYRDLSRLYLLQEHFQEAQHLLDDAVARWPDATWAYYRLGGLYVHLNLPEKAIESFRKVVAFEPVDDVEYAFYVEAHSALGNVYYDLENYEQAVVFFKKAIELNPADHSSMNNLAWVYALQQTELEEGLRLSRRSLRLNPNSPTYLDTLAELYFVMGDVDNAVHIIRQAIALDPDQPELRAHLRRQLARFLASGQGRA